MSSGKIIPGNVPTELTIAARLMAGTPDFACLCQDGKIILLNDAAQRLLGQDDAQASSLAGRHFTSLAHEADVWTLNSWWRTVESGAAPALGSRTYCRLGSPGTGWTSLELTRASHWAGERQYEIILGRSTVARTSSTPLPETSISTRPNAANIKNAAMLRRERVKRKWAERNVRRLAYQDHLTGLINRAYFQLRLKNTLRQAQRFERSVMLMVIDIDRFKEVNDRLGSEAGDQVLRKTAERIKKCMRATDSVARIGGDEFAVVISSSLAPSLVDTMAQKIMEAIAEPIDICGKTINAGCCIGISLFPADAQDAELLYSSAQLALSRAKQDGPGNYQIFYSAMNEQVRLRRQLEQELQSAISGEQLVLHYQPQVDINTGAVRGVEALIRWQHPERGMIPPVMFVPVAEASGLILPMTEWVIRTACADLKRCIDIGAGVERVSVNLSANLLLNPNLTGMIGAILKETGLPAKCLEVEITESMVMDDIEKSSKTLNSLYLLGVGLALDDFGTGYSSLTYLRQFPLSTLKIDRSFITEMSANAEDIAIVRAVIALAHSLHLQVIAEGVEEAGQVEILKQENCDQVQGYYFSRPLPLDDLIGWCTSRKISLMAQNAAGGELRSVS